MIFPLCWRGVFWHCSFHAPPNCHSLALEVPGPGDLHSLVICCLPPSLANLLTSLGASDHQSARLGASSGDRVASKSLRKPSSEGEGTWERAKRNVSSGGEWPFCSTLHLWGCQDHSVTCKQSWSCGKPGLTMGGRRKLGDKAQGPGVCAWDS